MHGLSPMCQPSTQSTAERHAQRRKIRHLLNTVTPRVKRDWCFAFQRLTGRKVVQSVHISFVCLWACLYLYFFNRPLLFFSLSPFFFRFLSFILLPYSSFCHSLFIFLCYFLCLSHTYALLYFLLIIPLSFCIYFFVPSLSLFISRLFHCFK